MKKLLSILSIAFIPGISFAQHYIYYNGNYGYENYNYGFHTLPLLLLILIPVISFLFCVAMFVFWLLMLVDAIKRAPEKMKIVWVIVIIFTTLIGALIYYFVEKRPREKLEYKKEEVK